MFLIVCFFFSNLVAGPIDWKAAPDPVIESTKQEKIAKDNILTQPEDSANSGSVDERAIIHTDNGFLPPKIYLKVKQNAKIYITGTTGKSTAFIIDDLNIFKGVSKDSVTEINLVPTKEGAYPFYCPITNKKGWIIVKGE